MDAPTRLPSSKRNEEFVRARAGCTWLAHDLSDQCSAINSASQVTEVLVSQGQMKE